MAVCGDCGLVQKIVTNNWLCEVKEIYSAYDVYKQSGGVEQVTFNQMTGESSARSQKIVDWLLSSGVIPETGSLLDIGCGNGAFLKVFSASCQGWKMMGFEYDGRNKQIVESIPRVTKLHVGSIDGINECFDLIVLIHALEHIPNPVDYLKSLAKKLKPGGLLCIEVPNLKTSPFDILIADHCSHFTEETLIKIVTSAGFEPLNCSESHVPKELSLLARYPAETETFSFVDNQDQSFISDRSEIRETENILKSNIQWLEKLLLQGKSISGEIGVFGSSISATWLTGSLDGKVSFFIDEDSHRIGHKHMTLPIYSPNEISISNRASILMPLRSDIAAAIQQRFQSMSLQFILPPEESFVAG